MSNFVHKLDWPEYLAVALSLIVSVGISFRYYRQNTGRPMLPLVPIIMSLIASSTSGVSLLGKPAESYAHGIQFVVFMASHCVIDYFLAYFLFLPIILKLKTVSIYEYFDIRFNGSVRQLVSVPYVIVRTLNTSLAVIPPVIVIHQFSGINKTILTISLTLLTTLYTMIGGFKGVVWTDAWQSVVMLLTITSLSVLSVVQVGGIERVFQVAYETNRLDIPRLTLDPSERISIWAYGSALSGMSTVILNQAIYQRLKSLSSEREVKSALFGLLAGVFVFLLATTFVGLAIYAFYHGCDPKKAQLVDSYSDVVVYWVNEVGQRISGIRGLYIAGITCASISTMSTYMNTIAELICTRQSKGKSQFKIRLATLGVGVVATVAALIMKDQGSLVELTFSFNCLEGIASGLFFFGALFVSANAKGALIGGTSTLVTFLLVTIGSRLFNKDGALKSFDAKIMRTDLCINSSISSFNSTMSELQKPPSNAFFLFEMSPFGLGGMMTIMTILVGLAVSNAFPNKDRVMTELDADLFSPVVHRFLPGLKETRDEDQILPQKKDSPTNETHQLIAEIPKKTQTAQFSS